MTDDYDDAPPHDDHDAPAPEEPPKRAGRQRVPPHDKAAEEALLASMLVGITQERALDVGLSTCIYEDFYLPAHAQVFAAIATLHAEGVPVDLVTVSDQIKRDGYDVPSSLLLDLHGITGLYPERYASIVAHAGRMRRALMELDKAAEAAYALNAPALASAVERMRAVVDAADAPASSWCEVDLAAILEGGAQVAPPEFLLRTDGQPILYAGKVHAFNAESESGKSWAALVAVAERLRAGEHALYVDFEDSAEGIVARLVALGVDPELIVSCFHYVRPDDPFDTAARANLERILSTFTPSLAVLDGVTEAMVQNGWSIIDNDDIAKFFAALPRTIARTGCAVVLIDHVTKDKESRGRHAIGGQHKLAGIDGATFAFEVGKPFAEGLDGFARITCTKDRPGKLRGHLPGGKAVGEMHVFASGDGVVVEFRPPEGEPGVVWSGPTECMAAVLRVLKAEPGMEYSQNALITALRATDHHYQDKTVREAAERLALDRTCSVRVGPRQSRLYSWQRGEQVTHEEMGG